MVFGKVPQYFGFIFTVLYLGGLLSAVWSGTSDGAIWGDKFAQGVGAASGILLIGSFGRLYRRNKLLGHIVGTIIIGTLALASYQYTNSPKPADTRLSKYYTNDMYSVLSIDVSNDPDAAYLLLMNPEFRKAVVASVNCENRSDLSMFVVDLWGASYMFLDQNYGRAVADSRGLIQENIRAFRSDVEC